MILFSIFMYLILKGTVADENDTTFHTGVQLWRVQGDLDEEVIDEFYERDAVDKDSFTWLAYPYLNDINRYLVKVASTYTFATVTSIGWTFKNNPITMLKISNGNPGNYAILMDGGIHGLERTAIISTLYFIDSLVKDFENQPEFIKNRDWYIIPVLNPDGYEFSLDFDPFWRKNRHKFSDDCVGVDLNRNFDYNWTLTGIVQDKCDSFYSGPNSFSEEETKALKNLTDRVQFKAYFSIHSAGSQILNPQNKGKPQSDNQEIIQFAKKMARAKSNVSNIQCRDGHIEEGFEFCTGNSILWMYHIKEVKHSYLIEARGTDANNLEKQKQIEVVAKEVKAAILKLAELDSKRNSTEMVWYFSGYLGKREPPKQPIKGVAPRIKNLLFNNFRGLIGVIVPVALLSWQAERYNPSKKVEVMWLWMFWFFLFQPVAIPVVGLIPVFFLPMSGSMGTTLTCQCYMNENIILFLLGSMLLLLLNNSGFDRRLGLWFLCSGDSCQFSAKRLIFKASTAAFFLSMFSSRLIVASTLTQFVTPTLMAMKASAGKGEPDFDEMRYLINNAIQTASGIGSTAIMHASYATLCFRAIFDEAPPRTQEYPDIFNYLQYSAFAFPVALVMFLLNMGYHMMLANSVLGKSMTTASMVELRKMFLKLKSEMPRRCTLHEKLSFLFLIIHMLMFFFRWNKWIDGWSEFRVDEVSPEIPRIKDATVAAIFVILLHVVPKGYGFLSFFDAEKKSQLPPLKAESAILWWQFVNRNTNYGYFFLIGAGISILNAARDTGLSNIIAENFGTSITGHTWNTSIFLVVFITSLLCNMMPSVPTVTIFLPLIMCMAPDAQLPWPSKSYIGALAVGIGASFGFCFPFMYTPAYFCHNTGKVPIKKMIKYSFVSVWICLIILWLALINYAPYLFDPNDDGIISLDVQGMGAVPTTTTEAPPAPPGRV